MGFRSTKRRFDRPASFEPLVDFTAADTKAITQLRDCSGDSSNDENDIASSVLCLGLGRIPHTVFGAISCVVVTPFDCKLGRAFAHILQKQFELLPPFADGYSSATIVGELGVRGVGATANHGTPRLVGSRRLTLSSVAMRKAISVLATARLRLTRYQVSPDNVFFAAAKSAAASALGILRSVVACRWAIIKNFPASKLKADERSFSRHDVRISVSNVVLAAGIQRQLVLAAILVYFLIIARFL